MVSNQVRTQQTQPNYRFACFQLAHVARSVTVVMDGDVCKETCKTPVPDPPHTCKLECHSGAPFADMQEEIPELVIC